jgi:hypothetical protein
MKPNYKIAYFLVTDTQHIPPVIRLHSLIGGLVLTCNKEIFETI